MAASGALPIRRSPPKGRGTAVRCAGAAASEADDGTARSFGSGQQASISSSRSSTTAHAAEGAVQTAADTPEASTSGRPEAYSTFDDDQPHECAYYDWKWGSKLYYVRAGRTGPPLLLCHGFGVGSYHFDRNISELAKNHRSGPLRYSADTWTEQLHHFITDKIGEPVYIAGNSLGGYLATNLAARNPDVVRGLVLLNATPFWSQRPPPGRESWLWKLLQVDGTVPVPVSLKRVIERFWWDQLRQPDTIRSLLQLVYARPSAIDDQLCERIVEATQRPEALDAFTSIVLSPKTELSFNEMLAKLQCPVCLAYGREDPWVVPLWGQRLKRALPAAQYLELTPAGHCPHHEAPMAINNIITTWVAAVEAGQHTQHELLQVGSCQTFNEADGQLVQEGVGMMLISVLSGAGSSKKWKASCRVDDSSSSLAGRPVLLWLQQQGYEATSSERSSAAGVGSAGRPSRTAAGVAWTDHRWLELQLQKEQLCRHLKLLVQGVAPLQPALLRPHGSKAPGASSKHHGAAGVATGSDCDQLGSETQVCLEAQLPFHLPEAKAAKRARILRDGELTLIPYGHDESQLWLKRVATFIASVRSVLGTRHSELRGQWGGSVLDSTKELQQVPDHEEKQPSQFGLPARGAVNRNGDQRLPWYQQGLVGVGVDIVDWMAVMIAPQEQLEAALHGR
eukprot:gene5832-6073_t